MIIVEGFAGSVTDGGSVPTREAYDAEPPRSAAQIARGRVIIRADRPATRKQIVRRCLYIVFPSHRIENHSQYHANAALEQAEIIEFFGYADGYKHVLYVAIATLIDHEPREPRPLKERVAAPYKKKEAGRNFFEREELPVPLIS